MKRLLLVMWMMVGCAFGAKDASALRILGFQDNNGYEHASMPEAKALLERLGQENGWEVVSSTDSSCLTELDLSTFDVVVFNNNCGNKGPVMKPVEQKALQKFVRNGGGFLGVHTAGALWKEGGDFQAWYEGLIGARQVKHPKVQRARLVVEDRTHPATRHLPKEWFVTDEWHIFDRNPRDKVNVLISLDERSYEGSADQKMGGDHPFVWYHEYDGGRSFFTSLGHTAAIYSNPDFEKLIEGAIRWTSGSVDSKGGKTPLAEEWSAKPELTKLPVNKGLLLDLDADKGVEVEDGKRVKAWHNQIKGNAADVFVKRDKGRKVPGSGRPSLKKNVTKIGGHNTLVFKRQELINMDEDVFDHLLTGNGYTWISVMSFAKQKKGKKDVNSFFGNLKNGSNYEGFWGCLADDNRVWMGSRGWPKVKEGKQALWNDKNPKVISPDPLLLNKYYVVMGRMGAGQGRVDLDLFVNSAMAVDSQKVPVNPEANSSLMAIGQERDATNHPGYESFTGEIARFMIFDRPLSNEELDAMIRHLTDQYQLGLEEPATGGLIGHWPLDGDFKDVSGNGYNGTVSEDPLEFAEGKHGKAADFRGASIINCGNVPLGTKGQLTVALWVKPSRVEQAFAGFVQKQNTDYSERSFWMGQHPRDGYFAWAQFTPPTAKGTQLKTSKAVLKNNQWTHVAITMDGTYQRIYVNGTLEATSEKRDSGIMDGGDNLRFGRVENTPGGRYSGLMDDIWIFDAALSENQIKKLMEGKSAGVDTSELSAAGFSDK